MHDMEQREGRPVPQVGRNVFVWGLVGAFAGCVLGVIIGFAFATPGGFGFWMAIVGATIFVGAVSAFTAGIASLGAPAPGREPADTPSSNDG